MAKNTIYKNVSQLKICRNLLSFSPTGVAYNAKITPIRLSDSRNNLTRNLAAAIRYAVDNGARVINMSLGSYIPDEETRQALAYAASRNVITVSAAGNSRDDNPEIAGLPMYPARYATDFGISVGAVDNNRIITDFSNLPGTDSQMNHVMAPGYDIYSTVPGNQYWLV